MLTRISVSLKQVILSSVLVIAGILAIPCALAQSDSAIKLGATLPLSGDLATYGNLIRGGIELAIEDLAKEKITAKLVLEDIPLSGDKVISGLNRLIQIEKVDGIAGNFSNVAMAAMGPAIEKAQIPSFHTSAADPLILDAGNYILTSNVRIKDEAYAMAEHLFSSGLKQIAVLSIQTNFGQAYREFFKERLLKLGGTITADETFEVGDLDYKAQLLKIRSSAPQAVYAGSFGRFLGYSLKQAREMGIKAPFFSVYESEDLSVLESAQGKAEGLQYFVTTSTTSSARFASFRDRFFARFSQEPGTFGSNAYDATILLGRALAKCNKDRACALKELYSTTDFDGVSGKFSIESDGATKKGFLLRQVKDNKFVDASK